MSTGINEDVLGYQFKQVVIVCNKNRMVSQTMADLLTKVLGQEDCKVGYI